MVDIPTFIGFLRQNKVEFITGVPDTLLNDFCLGLELHWEKDKHILAANEGNAIALAAGYHLATNTIPLVYMQNSGLGNAVNPLLSLADKTVYSIPMVLLIGWRGDPEVKDHPQHRKQGKATPALLECMDIPFRVLIDDVFVSLEWAVRTSREANSPTVLLVKKGVLAKPEKDMPEVTESIYPMSREEAIACILKCVPKDSFFVATTGRASRELHALRELNGEAHDHDFLNVGAMGHACSIATGVALAAKDRLIVCLDGDAALIMHLGSFTTTGMLGLPNFLHVVLNNGAHESVGGQPSAGFKADLSAMAANAAYKTIGKAVETEQDLGQTVKTLLSSGGPAFIEVRIRKGIRTDLPPLKFSHLETKELLMKKIR